MTNIVHLVRQLTARPSVADLPGISIRPWTGAGDVHRWLEIRRLAFARQTLGVRAWSGDDLAAEILDKPWWQPTSTWFADVRDESATLSVGTVTLGRRGAAEQSEPVVHWLAVAPRYRRRGIGRLLVAKLEQICWDAGEREIRLETHARWEEAARFYAALGYLPESAAG